MQAARIRRRRCNMSNAMHSGRNVWSRHSLCSKYAPKHFLLSLFLSIFHTRTHTLVHARVPFFAIIILSLFFSLFVLRKKNPYFARDHSKYNHFFSNRPRSSRFVMFLPSSIRKMHINTEVHFDASKATPGSPPTVVLTAIDTFRFHYCHSQSMHPNRNRSRGGKRQRGFEHPPSTEKADTVDTSKSFLSARRKHLSQFFGDVWRFRYFQCVFLQTRKIVRYT